MSQKSCPLVNSDYTMKIKQDFLNAKDLDGF